ncbi:hypothetical protein LSH36_128g04002 [Paralvinella palmiformis]|uniref:Uncharacterized protein n=1 Tax=Paralvinella palmiformis TaxID=53620 RepID=A0AAD9JWP7_9ANNE|nr:hypothetical protein LSH36_128g04002 [Paralvinella palmiformis]
MKVKLTKKVQDINIFRNAKDMADQLRLIASSVDCCQVDRMLRWLQHVIRGCHFLILPNSSHPHSNTSSSNTSSKQFSRNISQPTIYIRHIKETNYALLGSRIPGELTYSRESQVI